MGNGDEVGLGGLAVVRVSMSTGAKGFSFFFFVSSLEWHGMAWQSYSSMLLMDGVD